jgi:hypothetical protein
MSADSRTDQFISAGVSAFFAFCFAWLAWNGDGSDSAWRFGIALGWLGLALVWLVRGFRADRSGRGRDAQDPQT